jgi:hypothetical protein
MRSAGGAWMPARHPYSPAMTGGQTPHRSTGPSKSPPCVRCAPQEARGRDRYAQIEQARSASRRLALPGNGKRSPLRRSTWDFWPGPVLAVICPPRRRLWRIRTARLRPRSRAASAVPPGSCAFLRTGHRYPKEQVSRASPARLLTASATPRSRSALQERLRKAPLRSETNAICSSHVRQIQITNS